MSGAVIATRPAGVGSKHTCVSCAARFYDLTKVPAVCPKCGTEQPPEAPRAPPIRRSMRLRPMRSPGRPLEGEDAAPAAASETDEDADEAEADEDTEEAELAEVDDEEIEAETGVKDERE